MAIPARESLGWKEIAFYTYIQKLKMEKKAFSSEKYNIFNIL